MKNRVKKIWDVIFKMSPNLQKNTLQSVRNNVNVDTNLQRILLNCYLSKAYQPTPNNIMAIIRRNPKKWCKNG